MELEFLERNSIKLCESVDNFFSFQRKHELIEVLDFIHKYIFEKLKKILLFYSKIGALTSIIWPQWLQGCSPCSSSTESLQEEHWYTWVSSPASMVRVRVSAWLMIDIWMAVRRPGLFLIPSKLSFSKLNKFQSIQPIGRDQTQT